jgi:membrane protein
VLTFAFVLTLWSSSGAMVSIISSLNAAYDITEGRPLWRVRLTAICLTIGVAFFILISMALVLVGPTLAEHLADSLDLGAMFKWAWWVLQWPVVFGLVTTAIGLIYYFAPDAEQDWVWITPGSVIATLLWVAVSLGFKLYIAYFGNYNETYGTLGGFIVLLTWFYLSGLAILIGAEFNAEIEHASPYGKDVGEKVPGEKRKIGPAAARDYEERKKKGIVDTPPFPDHVNCDAEPQRPAGERNGLRPSDLVIGAAVLAPIAATIVKEVRDSVNGDSSHDHAA